ncbi:ATP synthase mitochondrial F1 complex assembly factor 1, partial [Armadillidium vulgare]
ASPDEFLNRAEKVLETPNNQDENEQWFSAKAEKGKAPLPQAAYAFAPQKKLESIMKTELLSDRTTDEIKYIWTQHFLQKDAISGIMPLDLFEKIQENAVKYPMAYQENAPECLTMVHYTELSKEKRIVLMHGTFNKDIIVSFICFILLITPRTVFLLSN